jgi:protein-disulfide isomerase
MPTMIRQSHVPSWPRLAQFLAAAVLSISASAMLVAQAAPNPTKVLDDSALHPPAGANVAIVEFSDLECPACAHANPLLKEAAAKYKIPLVRHDYLIPSHPWSKNAAIYARWFDTKGSGLGDAYRDAVFANQPSIYNVNVLAQFTQSFASSHGAALPFALDPQNKLASLVLSDNELGKRTGVVHTPTIFIVTRSKSTPYLEVDNTDRDLYRTIDQALAITRETATAANHSPTAKK